MNIIKENLFFVVMGAIVLLALILFVVIVEPLNFKNNSMQTHVRAIVGDLERLTKKEKLPNVEAIRQATDYHKKYDDQLDGMRERLAKMGLKSLLDGLVTDEPGPFLHAYDTSTEALKKRLVEKHIKSVAGTWNFWNWGDTGARDELQRLIATKEFFLMRELMDIVTSPELRVIQLDKMEVNPGELRTVEFKPTVLGRTFYRKEPYFDVYPFVLELRMPFDRHEILLRELLLRSSKGDIPIDVRKVSMGRIDDEPNIYKKVPPVYVEIRVEGWALDYHVLDKKTGAAAPGKGPGQGNPFGR